jgi:hypothetical protein
VLKLPLSPPPDELIGRSIVWLKVKSRSANLQVSVVTELLAPQTPVRLGPVGIRHGWSRSRRSMTAGCGAWRCGVIVGPTRTDVPASSTTMSAQASAGTIALAARGGEPRRIQTRRNAPGRWHGCLTYPRSRLTSTSIDSVDHSGRPAQVMIDKNGVKYRCNPGEVGACERLPAVRDRSVAVIALDEEETEVDGWFSSGNVTEGY